MSRRKVSLVIFLIVTFSTIVLLVTGSSILTIAVVENIPLGNFITWAGMISLPLSIFLGINEFRNPSGYWSKFLSWTLKIIILLAVCWVPLSYLLSGNLSFSFNEKESFQGGQSAMRWFWRLSYGINLGAILILILYWVSLIIKKVKTVGNNAYKK